MTNLTIYKYPFEITDEQHLAIQKGARPLCVAIQRGAPQLWALVDLDQPRVQRALYVVGTGHRANHIQNKHYVGTLHTSDGLGDLVWHVFLE